MRETVVLSRSTTRKPDNRHSDARRRGVEAARELNATGRRSRQQPCWFSIAQLTSFQ